MKIVINSGYFDPLHIGHIECTELSKKLGDKLVIILNNDSQCSMKKGKPFMPEEERALIIKSLKPVDEVFISTDKDKSVCETLKSIAEKYRSHEIIFAKGGTKGGTTNAWDFSVGIGGGIADANDTQRMFRFFSEDGVMSTQSADGTTQQETDVSAGLTLTNWNTYRIVFIAGTSVKFYINDVLKATHTTNIPSGTTQPTLVMGATSGSSGGNASDYDVIISNGYSIFITQS